MGLRILSQLAMLLLAATPACAAIAFAESIEWLADSRPHIAVGRIAGSGDGMDAFGAGTPPTSRVQDATMDVVVTEQLRGDPPPLIRVYKRLLAPIPQPPPDHDLLLFFLDTEVVDHALDLDSAEWSVAFTKDMRVLHGKAAILAALRERIANGPYSTGRRPVQLELPDESEAFRALFSGSSCLLMVPSDPDTRRLLLKWVKSPDAHRRSAAIRELAAYPDADTKRILSDLLLDDYQSYYGVHTDGVTKRRPYFPNRQAAFDALQEMGVPVAPPAGYAEDIRSREWWPGYFERRRQALVPRQ